MFRSFFVSFLLLPTLAFADLQEKDPTQYLQQCIDYYSQQIIRMENDKKQDTSEYHNAMGHYQAYYSILLYFSGPKTQ